MDFGNNGCGFQPPSVSPKTELICGYPSAETTSTIALENQGVGMNGMRRPSGYDSSSSPDSPDRHFCSSTTQSNGDLNHSRSEVSFSHSLPKTYASRTFVTVDYYLV